jgi:hypothetical protein
MTTNDLATHAAFTSLHSAYDDAPILAGYTSDLLSDVMAHAEDDSVLITIQAHGNTVAVATLAGMSALVICNARPIPADMLVAAERERIALFQTDMNQFEASCTIKALLDG